MTHQMRRPPTLAEDLATLLALRRTIADRIEADIALLDALDLDPDLEPNGDNEPSLGAIETVAAHRHDTQIGWGNSSTTDREMAIDDEPHENDERDGDAWLTAGMGFASPGSDVLPDGVLIRLDPCHGAVL